MVPPTHRDVKPGLALAGTGLSRSPGSRLPRRCDLCSFDKPPIQVSTRDQVYGYPYSSTVYGQYFMDLEARRFRVLVFPNESIPPLTTHRSGKKQSATATLAL